MTMKSMHAWTLWPLGLYKIDVSTPHLDAWSDLVERMSSFTIAAKKLTAPGFSPYSLKPPQHPCVRHKDHVVRENPHRCDACVDLVSLLVFDADLGTKAAVDECHGRIANAGYAQHWYTTHSWREDLPEDAPNPWRLLIPLAEPIPGRDLPALRSSILHQFAIPADPKKCSGQSHFYFMPTCPKGVIPRVKTSAGLPLYAYDFISPTHAPVASTAITYKPVPEPTEPVDLTPYRTELAARTAKWARARAHKQKADYVQAIIEGAPIGGPGDRNDPMCRVTGVLAWLFPEAPMSVLMALVTPSLRAMQAEGSQVTDAEVEGMFTRALMGKAAQDARDAELRAWGATAGPKENGYRTVKATMESPAGANTAIANEARRLRAALLAEAHAYRDTLGTD